MSARLRDAARRRQSRIHVLPPGRERADDRPRRRHRKRGVEEPGLRRHVHHDERNDTARARPQVHAGLLERPTLFHRNDRHRHGVGRQHRKAGLAEARLARGAHVHVARVLPAGRSRPRGLPPGRARRRRVDCVRRQHGRREVELERRRSRIRIAGRRGPRRDASDHRHHAEDARQRRRGDWGSAVAASVGQPERHQFDHARRVRPDGHRLGQRRSDDGAHLSARRGISGWSNRPGRMPISRCA